MQGHEAHSGENARKRRMPARSSVKSFRSELLYIPESGMAAWKNIAIAPFRKAPVRQLDDDGRSVREFSFSLLLFR
jgi:hypothetical protein